MNLLKAVSILLVLAMFSLALQPPAVAAEASLVNPKLLAGYEAPKANTTVADPPRQAATAKKEWTRGGKIMTGIGLGMIGVGAAMMPQKQSTDPGWHINWKATGGLWMGGGAVLTLIGLTRRR